MGAPTRPPCALTTLRSQDRTGRSAHPTSIQRSPIMLRGVFALLFRSLRTDSRSVRIHLLWFFLLAVIYIALWSAQETSRWFGAPGQIFFRYVVYLNAAFVTLLGVGFFSSAITEEKEEDTLGLMTMAGISPLGILMGKSTSRMFQVMVLLAIQYPFTLLAVTLGGLVPSQIASAYMSLFAYTILLANVGLLCSVLCRRSRDSAGLTTLWLVGYGIVPALAFGGFQYLIYTKGWTIANFDQNLILTPLKWLSESTFLTELYVATESGHEFTWSPQIVSNAVGGLCCFLLSWFLFRFVVKDPAPEASSRGWVARRTSRRWRLFSAGRAWDMSLVWKDFHFIGGGWAGVTIRCLLYLGLYVMCYFANRPSTWGQTPYSGWTLRWEDVTWGFLFFSYPLLASDIALCASRLFQEEIKGQTLSSLLMLPRSIPDLAYSKVLGCGLGLLPGVMANLFAVFCLPGGMKLVGEALREPGWWYWMMNLVLLIHLTVVLSLHLRWGALAMAFGLTAGTMFFTGLMISIMSIGGGGNIYEETFGGLAVMIGFACIACHAIVLVRLPKLGER